jgi:hypothetical protein
MNMRLRKQDLEAVHVEEPGRGGIGHVQHRGDCRDDDALADVRLAGGLLAGLGVGGEHRSPTMMSAMPAKPNAHLPGLRPLAKVERADD